MARQPIRAKNVFHETLSAAIDDLSIYGFNSQARVDEWLRRLETAARAALVPEYVLERKLRDMLLRTYQRVVADGQLLKIHKGVGEYTLAAIKPKLRSELDRRIMASANLIRLNRQASIQRTLQRFAGWSTSIPAGGSAVVDKAKAKAHIRRGIAALPFEERRVIIDQGHKLTAAVNEIVATDGGAIAGIWHSHWREPGYQFRKDHKEMDEHVYVIRDNWALRRGLMKLAGTKYTDQVVGAAEEPYCRCYYQYIYALRDLPAKMLTEKGKNELSAAQRQVKAWSGEGMRA